MSQEGKLSNQIPLTDDPILPLKLYGAEFSCFTGKLEGVLRYLELPHQRLAGSPTGAQARATGVAQVPALHLADGRWLTDTTPIIAWLDRRYPQYELIPRDPVLAFFSPCLRTTRMNGSGAPRCTIDGTTRRAPITWDAF